LRSKNQGNPDLAAALLINKKAGIDRPCPFEENEPSEHNVRSEQIAEKLVYFSF
jgi:hypothetical protein